MDPRSPTARRFPLIARFRPACLPLPERVHALGELAAKAAESHHQGLASAVYNQAALIASDTGLPGFARDLCHQHAAAYLHACPLPAKSAIHALEPVVNLTRLRIRSGHPDDGRRGLLRLYEAVGAGTATRIEGIAVPARLTATAGDRHEIRAWLWHVLLADGTRSLTAAGQWKEALAHLTAHHGIGNRMLDGRQVAVVAALVAGGAEQAADLLTETTPGEPWERVVTLCLNVLTRQVASQPTGDRLPHLVDTYLHHDSGHGMTVFDTRLGLTVLDALGPVESPAARKVVENLHQRTAQANDGYAARDGLAHPTFTALATVRQIQDCESLVRACALGRRGLSAGLLDRLAAAVRLGDATIRHSLAEPAKPAPAP
ncbi:hypothetical protein [Streptomyces laurentii]|uniref:hypothetical protein n=1 Tax=Streptomyces laurentii TaxID=39478 RepID=UPI003400F8D7